MLWANGADGEADAAAAAAVVGALLALEHLSLHGHLPRVWPLLWECTPPTPPPSPLAPAPPGTNFDGHLTIVSPLPLHPSGAGERRGQVRQAQSPSILSTHRQACTAAGFV